MAAPTIVANKSESGSSDWLVSWVFSATGIVYAHFVSLFTIFLGVQAEEGSGIIPLENLEATLPDPEVLLEGNQQLCGALDKQPDKHDFLELISDHVGLATILVRACSSVQMLTVYSD